MVDRVSYASSKPVGMTGLTLQVIDNYNNYVIIAGLTGFTLINNNCVKSRIYLDTHISF